MSGRERGSFEARDGVGIGEELRRAREERGLMLEDVERATKIRRRYLEGIEREDYGVMPAPVYVRGFVRTYADYLGLDGEEYARRMREYQATHLEEGVEEERVLGGEDFAGGDYGSPPPLVSSGGIREAERRRRFSGSSIALPIFAVVLLFVIVAAFYYLGRVYSPGVSANNHGGADKVHPAAGERQVQHSEHGKGHPAGGNQKTTRSLEARLDVSGGPSWLEVRSDGEVVFVRTVEPGFSKTFTAKHEISITSGNAGAVRVRINGQNYGTLGDMGEVLTRTFTLKQAGSS
ncbi:helix-turn-helix domain-containing protein [Rubrobacter calidifluminis]|uniref:helix-turn-helix domain-containing protein n=1 Tax=Rubrobacter calidifluminis TaxID=1392640 RepID=UPI00235F61CE|nr:helix-turn-helix domain-containing protein [Rubrobacter calidifluminis]